MKKNIEWYPHRKDSHRHPKFKMLRALYGGGNLGWAMEGRFWALNNIIADSEECRLDLSKTRNKAVIAEELSLSLDELEQFVDNLRSPAVELLYEIERNIYSNKKILQALGFAIEEREKAKKRWRSKRPSENFAEKEGTSGEDLKTSGEKGETSPENLYRVKDMRVHDMTEDKSKRNPDDENVDNLPLTPYPEIDLPLITSYQDYEPKSFEDKNHVRNCIENLLTNFTREPPSKETISSYFNRIMDPNDRIKESTAFKLLFESCMEYHKLEPKKQNYAYLFRKFTGKMDKALTAALEKLAKKTKQIEGQEIKNMNQNHNNLPVLDKMVNKMKIN